MTALEEKDLYEFEIELIELIEDVIESCREQLENNNIFTIARRTIHNDDSEFAIMINDTDEGLKCYFDLRYRTKDTEKAVRFIETLISIIGLGIWEFKRLFLKLDTE